MQQGGKKPQLDSDQATYRFDFVILLLMPGLIEKPGLTRDFCVRPLFRIQKVFYAKRSAGKYVTVFRMLKVFDLGLKLVREHI